MPKGNPKAYLNANNNYISGDLDLTEDENKNHIDFIKESFNCFKPDLSKPEEVNKAIELYFDRCYRHNIRPGNMGLYNALGLTRQEVNEYLTGRRKTPNAQLIDTIKKVKSEMAEYREVLGSSGKLSPPVLIFWQKNHDNFTDVQQIDINPVGQLEADKTPEELQRMIEQDIPIDAE